MIKFEKVKRFADADFNLPVRKTRNSAGYDFEVAEDIIIPSFYQHFSTMLANADPAHICSLEETAKLTKEFKTKPTLVSTGVKCYLEEGYYLELSVRSSTPLKYWIVLANSVGIIDADYCDNPDNEGEIFFQVINLSPFPIQLHKGDIIGQGIIKRYEVTDNDKAIGERQGGFGSTTKSIQYNLYNGVGTNVGTISFPERGLRAQAGIYDEAMVSTSAGAQNFSMTTDEAIEMISNALKEDRQRALMQEFQKSLFDACM